MHELSIAMSIVDIAEEKVKESDATTVVKEIELEIGELSGVMIEALEFALQEVVKNTLLQSAKRKIIKIPGKAKCRDCATEFTIEDIYTPCPKCNEYNSEVIQGKELRVKSLLID